MVKIPFAFYNTPYIDPNFEMTITLSGSGCAVVEDDTADTVTESMLSAAVASAISELSAEFGYDKLPRNTERLLPLISSKLSGTALSAVEFSACYPDDESVAAIIRKKRAASPQPSEMSAPAEVPEISAPSFQSAPTGNTLVLISKGPRFVEVIKYFVDNFGLGLAAAKAITDNTPAVICENLTSSQIETHICNLSKLGAEAASW